MAKKQLPSIDDLEPQEIGGRVARNGFIYQDHLGVKYLLNSLNDEETIAIAFETEDDIVIVKRNIIELVQVKSNDLSSNWSAAKLVDEDIVQKSINRGRFKEDVIYKVATLTGVNKDLECLCDKQTIGKRKAKDIKTIADKIKKKKAITTNIKKHGLTQWLQNCHWVKEPDSIDLITAECFRLIEDYVHNKYSTLLLPTQKSELYQQILAFVQEASTSSDITKARVDKEAFIIWLENKLNSIVVPLKGFEKLTKKMNDASINETTIASAKEMKWKFTVEERERKYIGQNQIDKIKDEIQILVQELLKQLDTGNLNCSRDEFHNICVIQVDKIADKYNISKVITRGCMYDITNRCAHRFTKPIP